MLAASDARFSPAHLWNLPADQVVPVRARARPGHDFRYALDNAKIESELGWRPETKFEDGLSRTVDWYREHPDWWRPLKVRLLRESSGFWTDSLPTKDQGQWTKDVL